jgi:hypothetical protein
LGVFELLLALLHSKNDAATKIKLPTGVAETWVDSMIPTTKIYWSLGDPLPDRRHLSDWYDRPVSKSKSR